MRSGKGKACIESALRAATSGTLDKGVEAREAGNALVLALVQVPISLALHLAECTSLSKHRSTMALLTVCRYMERQM